MSASLLAVTGLIFWARNRGFDLTDEGYYLLLYALPDAGASTATQFHQLVDFLNGPFRLGIPAYRIAGLIVFAASSGFLGTAFYRFAGHRLPRLSEHLPSRPLGVAFVTLMGLLGYSRLPLTLSYNTLSAALVQVTAATVLLGLSRDIEDPTGAWRQDFPFAIAGSLLAFLLFVKWPSALILAGLCAIFVMIVRRGRAGAIAVLLLGGGFVLGFLILTEEVVGGIFSLDSLVDGSAGTAGGGTHNPAALLQANGRQFVAAVVRVFTRDPIRLVALVLLLSGPAIARRIPRSSRGVAMSAWGLMLVGALFILIEAIDAPYYDRDANFRLLVSVLVALPIAAAVTAWSAGRSGQANWTRHLVSLLPMATLGFLVALPFATALGSNSSIFRVVLHSSAGFAVAILLVTAALQIMLPSTTWALSVPLLVLPILSLVFVGQIFHGSLIDPYRLETGLNDQTEVIETIPTLRNMRVDVEAHAFLTGVHQIVTRETSFEPGDPILGLSKVPGLIYMLGGFAPGAAWIPTAEPGEQLGVCEKLRGAASDVAATEILLLNSDLTPEMDSCLRELWVPYPDQLVEVGRVAIPGEYGAGGGDAPVLRVLHVAPAG